MRRPRRSAAGSQCGDACPGSPSHMPLPTQIYPLNYTHSNIPIHIRPIKYAQSNMLTQIYPLRYAHSSMPNQICSLKYAYSYSITSFALKCYYLIYLLIFHHLFCPQISSSHMPTHTMYNSIRHYHLRRPLSSWPMSPSSDRFFSHF